MPCVLPVDHVIHNRPLFRGRLAEIDARGLDAFMPHEIGKKSNIVAALQKALCETVPERVRVDHSRVDVIAHGKLLELTGDAPGRNPIPVLVQKNEAAFLFLFCQPGNGFILQCLGNVNPPELATLGVEVNVSEANVFDLDLNQFAHSGTRCRKEADHKIPEHFAIALKAILEVGVISLADHIFQKCFLLHSHKGQLPFCFPDALKIAVHGAEPEVDRLGAVALDQPDLVGFQVPLCDFVVLLLILLDCEQVRSHRVFREVRFSQMSFKFFCHGERPPFTTIIQKRSYKALIMGKASSTLATMRNCSLSGGSGIQTILILATAKPG